MLVTMLAAGTMLAADRIESLDTWGLAAGEQAYVRCRRSTQDDATCRGMAEGTFRAQFPDYVFRWPDCGKDRDVEVLLWQSAFDRGGVDLHMRRLHELCPAREE